MSLQDIARYWNATPEERRADYPCDAYLEQPYERFVRAVDVDAPVQIVFRWLCQLKVAPYSYDWVDNRGRRSPRQLTSGAGELEFGQRLLVFSLVDFAQDRHLTGVSLPGATRAFGPMAVTYMVLSRGEGVSRLVGCIDVGAVSTVTRIRRAALAWGDLIMARKQLLTLRDLAERGEVRGPGRRDAGGAE